jgi:hypothetical protein
MGGRSLAAFYDLFAQQLKALRRIRSFRQRRWRVVGRAINAPLNNPRSFDVASELHQRFLKREVLGRPSKRAKGTLEIAMQESKNEFKSEQAVVDAIQAAREAQEHTWEAWFAVRDIGSAEFESARLAFIDANLEVNRLVEIYGSFRRHR